VADWNRWQCRTLDTLPDVEKAAFLKQIGKKKSLAARLENERRLMELEVATIQELQN
jgi:hypothetical protein